MMDIKYTYINYLFNPNNLTSLKKLSLNKLPRNYFDFVSIADFNTYDTLLHIPNSYKSAAVKYCYYLTDSITKDEYPRYSLAYLNEFLNTSQIYFKNETFESLINSLVIYYSRYKNSGFEKKFNQLMENIPISNRDIKENVVNLINRYDALNKPFPDDVLNATLIDYEGREFPFSELVKKYKGCIIYIDFWASWCAPCIKEFPASNNLNRQVEDKKVVFLYLSIDERRTDFLAASKKNLSEKKSYQIKNASISRLNDYLDFSSIPKYIIVDKDGKLVNRNAPRPSDPNTIELLLNK